MKIIETHLNKTENYTFSEDSYDIVGTALDGLTWGEMFREFQSKFGRCTSKVYVDIEGEPTPVGWVFESRKKYEDTGDYYVHEVWITAVLIDEVVRHRQYQSIGKAS